MHITFFMVGMYINRFGIGRTRWNRKNRKPNLKKIGTENRTDYINTGLVPVWVLTRKDRKTYTICFETEKNQFRF